MKQTALTLLIVLVGAALFLFRLGIPDVLVFDETHYIPAAKALAGLTANTNTEHPLFAKQVIALGMALFGDNGFGWRVGGALLSAISLGAIFQIALILFRDPIPAFATAWLVMVDQTFFVQARIAMLDGPAYALLFISIAVLLWSAQVERSQRAVYGGLIIGGVCLGLAAGSKWIAGIYAGMLLAGLIGVRLSVTLRAKRPMIESLLGEGFALWPRLNLLTAGLVFGLTSLVIYFATFWPLPFLARDPVPFADLLGFQFNMLGRQSAALQTHPFESPWWSWPLMLEPIWYHFVAVGDKHETIFYVGNPVIYWGGLVALVIALWSGVIRRNALVLGLASAFLTSWLIWAILPKQIGFLFYYSASAVLLSFVIIAALQLIETERRRQIATLSVCAAATLAFAYFYPVLAAVPIEQGQWLNWVWLDSWT